jgi:hypothetical protein
MGSANAHRTGAGGVLGYGGPQRTLREIANVQDGFGKRFKQLIQTAAPALDLSGEQPLSNELLFSWHPSYVSEKPT